MNKTQKSGAEKRKLKAEKEQKSQQLVSKIPKLTSIFQTENVSDERNQQSSIADSSTEAHEHSRETSIVEAASETLMVPSSSTETLAVPSTSTEIPVSDIAIAAQIDTVGCCEFPETQENDSHLYSNDPGLWPVEFNQTILQNIWIKKGTHRRLILYLTIEINTNL